MERHCFMKVRILWLIAFLLFTVQLSAQQKVTVKGKITDEHNEPVIGANIMEKGTTNGVISDFDGFFVYGLGWGVNQGILKDRKYKKAARKGWKALKSYVHEDGMLGYVQPVSAAPEQVTQNMTEVYGVGAFLMAGIEMLKMK